MNKNGWLKCPKCGYNIKIKLKCKRCGHEWYPRTPGVLPRVCPNPKCKSPYWNKERIKKSKGKK